AAERLPTSGLTRPQPPPPPPPPANDRVDPPTKHLTLADELLGGPDDKTIELPVRESRDER
ncbi:MAG: hypothetical protein QOH80_385, partial [Actinomycetota bacterium]|nr:hypothetical protein [Actinomycetota bacterium]